MQNIRGHRAVLLLVVKEERAVRKTADQVVTPVLPYEPVFPHADIMPKTLGLYQQCCINMLTLLTPPLFLSFKIIRIGRSRPLVKKEIRRQTFCRGTGPSLRCRDARTPAGRHLRQPRTGSSRTARPRLDSPDGP